MPMQMHIAIVICAVGGFFALLTLELVRRKHLRPEYALLWAALAVLTVVVALVPRNVVELLISLTGMTYQSSVIVLLFIFTAVMLMNYSVIASRHGGRIVRLTQEVALLRLEIERLRSEKEAGKKSHQGC
jgi:hypothetical protein